MVKKRKDETQDEQSWLAWLVQQSMLENVKPIAARYSGQGKMWQHPYAETRPHAAAARASVWFTAYPAALITRSGESVLRTLQEYAIDPASLIHALQNHDELTLELVHFWTRHKDDQYIFQDKEWTGAELREEIRATMYVRLSGEAAPYNLKFVTNGIACTTVSVIAAVLGIRDLDQINPAQKAQIQRIHLLLAMYNAFQPGVFALSGWDLVGALPLPRAAVASWLADGDTRWINRGAYDLMNINPAAAASTAGLPKATTLYGPIAEQLQQPNSFVSQLPRLLAVRRRYRIYAGRQIEIPEIANKGLLVLVHELPDTKEVQVTALNFGAEPLDEVVAIKRIVGGTVVDMFSDEVETAGATPGHLWVSLAGYAGKSYLIRD